MFQSSRPAITSCPSSSPTGRTAFLRTAISAMFLGTASTATRAKPSSRLSTGSRVRRRVGSHVEAATLPCAALDGVARAGCRRRDQSGGQRSHSGDGRRCGVRAAVREDEGATAIVTSSSDAKLERAKALGADHTINYKSETRWGEAVRTWTGGRGVDHVLENRWAPGRCRSPITAARVGGHVSLIGILTGSRGTFRRCCSWPSRSSCRGSLSAAAASVGHDPRAGRQCRNTAGDRSRLPPHRRPMPSATKKARRISARSAWRCDRYDVRS